MSSIIWYLYEFAKKNWLEGFANAKSHKDITEKPSRFRDFPTIEKENCIGCGSCTASCPSPTAIKLIRDTDSSSGEGLTYPIFNKSACIRCGFCAEVCPSDPKTIHCGENHYIHDKYTIIPREKMYMIDDFLCIGCGNCYDACPVGAVKLENGKYEVNQFKCIKCGKCQEACQVKGAMKGIYIHNLEEQKKVINLTVKTIEEYVDDHKEDLLKLPAGKLLKLKLPLSNFWNQALSYLDNEEECLYTIENATDRLTIRIITWNSEECKKCQMCIPDCPTGAITFDKEKDTIVRDKNKCLRCSICYQTCPFGVIKYFIAKNVLDKEEKVINITCKPSDLGNDFKPTTNNNGDSAENQGGIYDGIFD
ncbi:MAG: 4Fe-4S binding protein [Methanobacteriaceae archaeon]|nr:4Fe-4S binding protein [Methanobacteriaceae archaeon]